MRIPLSVQWRQVCLFSAPLLVIGWIVGLDWMKPVRRQPAPYVYEATLVIEFPPNLSISEPHNSDSHIRDCTPNINDYLQWFQARRIAELAFQSYNSSELLKILGLSAAKGRRVFYTKVRCWADRNSRTIFVRAIHQNEAAATLLVRRHGEVLLNYLLNPDFNFDQLSERRAELESASAIDRQQLAALRQAGDSAEANRLGAALETRAAHLQAIDERIAKMASQPQPFQLKEIRVRKSFGLWLASKLARN